MLIAAIGDTGDAIQFTEYISKNLALYKMRNGYELGPKAAAHFTRRNLADYLRSRTPYHVNLLVAGYNEQEGPELHFIDYIANAKSLNYAGHGYGGIFAASIFDRYHHASKWITEPSSIYQCTKQMVNDFVFIVSFTEITQDEAYDILKKCILEIQKRLIVNLNNFHVAVVDKAGVHRLEDITSKTLINYVP